MIYELYSIYDKKENRHTEPFCMVNLDTTLRTVKEQISSIPFPADKQLKHVGWFDVKTGKTWNLDVDNCLNAPVELSTLIDKGEPDNAQV